MSEKMVEEKVVQKLNTGFAVQHLSVANESHMHNVPPGSESHFKVILVSDDFIGKNKVKQHQAVYKLLADELAGPIHALALHTFTVQQWQLTQQAPDSPNCLGGS
jgi:BolA protein